MDLSESGAPAKPVVYFYEIPGDRRASVLRCRELFESQCYGVLSDRDDSGRIRRSFGEISSQDVVNYVLVELLPSAELGSEALPDEVVG